MDADDASMIPASEGASIPTHEK